MSPTTTKTSGLLTQNGDDVGHAVYVYSATPFLQPALKLAVVTVVVGLRDEQIVFALLRTEVDVVLGVERCGVDGSVVFATFVVPTPEVLGGAGGQSRVEPTGKPYGFPFHHVPAVSEHHLSRTAS